MLPRCYGAAAILVFAAAMAASPVSSAAAANSPLAGRWEGTVQGPGSSFTMVLDLDKDSTGQWAGSAIFPAFGVKGAPLKDVTVKDSEISFSVRSAMGDPKLTGRLAADGVLSGTYEEAGHSVPFSLKRAGVAQVDYPRPCTPIRKEVEGRWESLLDIGAFKLKLGFKMTSGAKGLAEGEFTMIDPGNFSVPMDLISQDGDRLELIVASLNFGYEGLISKSNDEMKGILRMGSLEFPLVWQRTK